SVIDRVGCESRGHALECLSCVVEAHERRSLRQINHSAAVELFDGQPFPHELQDSLAYRASADTEIRGKRRDRKSCSRGELSGEYPRPEELMNARPHSHRRIPLHAGSRLLLLSLRERGDEPRVRGFDDPERTYANVVVGRRGGDLL